VACSSGKKNFLEGVFAGLFLYTTLCIVFNKGISIMSSLSAKYSQFVMPDHINVVGTLFGGQMIAWVDLAAAKVAYRFLKSANVDGAVTRTIDQVEFKEPVYLGDWVNFMATIVAAGTTSFKIQVEAHAEGRNSEPRLACVATIVMVSVKKDENGKYQKTPHGQSC
jgi:acyl-CoA hydrolase